MRMVHVSFKVMFVQLKVFSDFIQQGRGLCFRILARLLLGGQEEADAVAKLDGPPIVLSSNGTDVVLLRSDGTTEVADHFQTQECGLLLAVWEDGTTWTTDFLNEKLTLEGTLEID